MEQVTQARHVERTAELLENMARNAECILQDDTALILGHAAKLLKATRTTDQAKDEEIARYRAALEAILNEETVSVHVGYDSGSGGGNFVYADAVRTDSEAFDQARAALEMSNA